MLILKFKFFSPSLNISFTFIFTQAPRGIQTPRAMGNDGLSWEGKACVGEEGERTARPPDAQDCKR